MSKYNPNSMHYGHTLRVNNQILAENQTITNDATVGNGKPIMADRTQGSMSIVIQASTAGTIDANDTITVQLMQSEVIEMTNPTDAPVLFKKTWPVAKVVTPGMVLGVLPLSEEIGPYIAGYISGTAGIAIDLVASYVPR